MGLLLHLAHALVAQDPIENANGVASLLDRGSTGVAALAILGLVAVFWLYVRKGNRVESIVEKTTQFLGSVTHALADMVKSLEARDVTAKEIKKDVQEMRREIALLLERIPPKGGN